MAVDTPVRHPDAPAVGDPILSHYEMCFGCGSAHPAPLGVELTAGQGVSVVGTVLVTENQQGAPGLAHGGVLAAVMDELLGSINWLLMSPSVTARLTTDFVRPVPVGSTLHLSAHAVRVEGRKLTVRGEGRLDAADGPIAVRAEGLFVQVPREHFARHGRAQEVASAQRAWNPDVGAP